VGIERNSLGGKMDATYVSSNTFTVDGNRTLEFTQGRRLKLTLSSGDVYCTVSGSTYSGGTDKTSVTTYESELTATLSVVLYGVVNSGEYGSLPDHTHDGSEGSGGTISGTGGGGTSDHSALSNLNYASAGHTGFASSSDLSTTSGILQNQIDNIDITTFSGTSVHVDGDATVTGTMYAHIYDSYSPLTIKDGGVTVITGDGAGNINFPAGATVSGSPLSDGQDGADGKTWYSGSGAPSNAIGVEDDFYYDESNGDVYKKDGIGTGDSKNVGGSASGNGTYGGVWDNNDATAGGDSGGSIVRSTKYDFGSGVAWPINYIRVYRSYQSYHLEGSNNAVDWDRLSSSGAHPSTEVIHTFSNTTPYRYIQWRTQNVESGYTLYTVDCRIADSILWQLNSNIKGADGADAPTTFSGLSDTPSSYDEGKYLRSTASGTEWAEVSGGSGASTFLDLTDTPTTYSGAEGKYLRATASGTEWATVSGAVGSSNFLELTDTPSTYNGGTEIFTDTYTKLLLQSDTYNNSVIFVDSSYLNNTINVYGNTKHSTAQSKIGSTSIYTDDDGDGLYITDNLSEFQFGSGKFTIDLWAYIVSGTTTAVFAWKGGTYGGWNGTTGHEWGFYIYEGTLYFQYYTGTGTPGALTAAVTSYTDQWIHWAVVQTDTHLTLYRNGSQIAQNSAVTITQSNDASQKVLVGNISTLEMSVPSYRDEIRIVKGEAKWTSGFTPETTHYSVSELTGPYARTQFLTINETNDGLAFQDLPNNFIDLDDTPTTYSGQAGKFLISTASGIEFSDFGVGYVESDFKAHELVGEYTYSSETLNIDLTSLTCDTDDTWLIEAHLSEESGSSNAIKLNFNNDTANNYTRLQWGAKNDSTSLNVATSSLGYCQIGWLAATTGECNIRTELMLKSGTHRTILSFEDREWASDPRRTLSHWTNTADEITSMQLTSVGNCSGYVRIYKFKKVDLPVSSGASTFLDLTDTPATYSGAEGKYLRATASGTEWATVSGGSSGASTLLELTDTPASYDQRNYLRTTASGIIFSKPIQSITGVPDLTTVGYVGDFAIDDTSGDIYEKMFDVGNRIAKSVVVDVATSWGATGWMAIRLIEFSLGGTKYPLTSSDFSSYGESFWWGLGST
jgi:hypothetical protein